MIIYTANVGNYDIIKSISRVRPGYRYVCYTDNQAARSDFWEIRNLDSIAQDCPGAVLKSRYIKFFPHKLFPEEKHSLYLDCNIDIVDDQVYQKIETLISDGSLFSLARHFKRNCVYDEIVACAEQRKDLPENLRKMEEFLRSQGYPEQRGLYSCGVLFRDHASPLVQRLMSEWWEMFSTLSRRDQLSLPYLLDKHQLEPIDWNCGHSLDKATWIYGVYIARHGNYKKPKFYQRWLKSIKKRVF